MFTKKKKKSLSLKTGVESAFAQALMPAAAFVAFPRFEPPPFEGHVLRPVGMTGLSGDWNVEQSQVSGDERESSDVQNEHQQFSADQNNDGVRRAPGLGAPVGFGDTDEDSVTLTSALEASMLQTYSSPKSLLRDDSNLDSTFVPEQRRRAKSAGPEETRRRRGPRRHRAARRPWRSNDWPIEPVTVDDEYEFEQHSEVAAYTVPLSAAPASPVFDPNTIQLQSLESQLVEADDRQRQLESEMQRQSLIQNAVQRKLMETSLRPDELGSVEIGSLLRESHSVTEQTIRRQNDYCKSLENKISVLEAQIQHLHGINEQQSTKLESLRKQRRQPVAMSEDYLTSQINEFRNDADSLKSIIHRLNQELSRYQTKFRTLTENEVETLPGLPLRGPKPLWLVNTKYLSPLILAYDDHLKEKNDVIVQYELELKRFRKEFEEVLAENKRLHIRLEQSGAVGQHVGMSQWRQLQEQCKLVLEENELMMKQLKLQEEKYKQWHNRDIQEVLSLTQRTRVAESECVLAQREAADLREKYADVRRQNDQLVFESLNRVATDEHINKLAVLKQVYEGEKKNLRDQVESLSEQLQISESSKESLLKEVEKLSVVAKQLEHEMRKRNKVERKYQKNVEILQLAMDKLQLEELTVEQYLNSVLTAAAKVAEERDGLAHSIEEHDKNKQKAWKQYIVENIKKSEITEKLLSVRHKAETRVEEVVKRMTEKELEAATQREAFESEIQHLRQLLREKNERVTSLETETKDLANDLETMWQAATRSNQEMWQKIREKEKRLGGQHGGQHGGQYGGLSVVEQSLSEPHRSADGADHHTSPPE